KDSRIWLLPEPDSPTIPTTSPCFRSKLTRSTAVTQPWGSLNWTERSWTASTVFAAPGGAAGSAVVRVGSIAGCGGSVVEAEQHGSQERARQDQQPGVGIDLAGAVIDEAAPARIGRLHAEAEEAQETLGEDRFQHQQARIDDHHVDRIRHDVLGDDLEIA